MNTTYLMLKPECKMTPTFASSTGWCEEKRIEIWNVCNVTVQNVIGNPYEGTDNWVRIVGIDLLHHISVVEFVMEKLLAL